MTARRRTSSVTSRPTPTTLPLEAADEAFQAPFARAGYDIARIAYFGESVLLPEWRGHGAGHRFFDAREAHARQLGRERMTFCAVQRAHDHPWRPPGYRPLDDFWLRRGYRKHPELSTRYAWQDLGATEESEKTLVFWMRESAPQPV